jgi:hypothetical protein
MHPEVEKLVLRFVRALLASEKSIVRVDRVCKPNQALRALRILEQSRLFQIYYHTDTPSLSLIVPYIQVSQY